MRPYIAIYSHEAYLACSGKDMASLYPAGPVRSGYNGLTHGFSSGPYFEHQSCANNVQRLPRIHSHIRDLFWTSKLFLLASTWRPPLISQLPVCTCHLSECVLYNHKPVSVTPLPCYHVEETECSHVLRHKVALINEAESANHVDT